MGSTCVGVEFLLGTLRGSLCLAVWVPVVPLRLSLSDPKLNAIDGWSQYTDNGLVGFSLACCWYLEHSGS